MELRKEGKHRSFMGLEFWAENGLICIEDKRDGEFTACTRREFGQRARAINEEAKRAGYADERKRLQDAVLEMYECWKDAKDQGDPTNPEVAKQLLKARRKKATIITGWDMSSPW